MVIPPMNVGAETKTANRVVSLNLYKVAEAQYKLAAIHMKSLPKEKLGKVVFGSNIAQNHMSMV